MARQATAINGGVKPPPPSPATVEEFKMLPIEQLCESPLNPRKHYNPHKLEELADSIDERGVITPLIVRDYGTSTKTGLVGRVVYEIAAGHRRYRAAKSLERPIVLPCRIMILDDDEFLEVLTIENLQREDIHPLEEADGYKALLATGRYREPDFAGEEIRNLADKIGKPENYVRGRLELCDLIPVVRESFLQDNITIGHARLISRVPIAKQEGALGACFETYGDRALQTVANFRRTLQHLLKGEDLGRAPFDLADPTLKSDAGACTNCPKCSAPQRSLVDDMEGALCLDGGCYSQKLNAHLQRSVASGMVAISTRYSGDIKEGALSAREYVEAAKDVERIEDLKREIEAVHEELNDPEMLDPKKIKSLDDEIKKLYAELAEAEAKDGTCAFSKTAIVVDDSYSGVIGKTTQICVEPTCPVHGEFVKENEQFYGDRKRAEDPKEAERKAKQDLERKIDRTSRRRAWEAIQLAMDAPEPDFFVLRIAAANLIHMANGNFCKAFGIEVAKGQFAGSVVKKWLADASQEDVIRFIVLIGLSRPGLDEYFHPENARDGEWKLFNVTLDLFDVDLKAIKKEVSAELKAKSAKKPKSVAVKKATRGKKAAANYDEDGDE